MRNFYKKVLFLDGVLLYLFLIFVITGKLSVRQTADQGQEVAADQGTAADQETAAGPGGILAAQIQNDSDKGEIIDPYKELTKKVALTFDDGPDPDYTEKLLDGLKEREVRATFFVLGKQAEKYPKIIERMQEEGHLIGNHTYSHIQLRASNREEFKEELSKTSGIVSKITGEEVQYVRPPYGTWDKKLEKELNMIPVLWTIDPLDWCKKDASCIARNVVNTVEENDIILMHDQYPSSVASALKIVDELKKQGYEFVTVEELLGE